MLPVNHEPDIAGHLESVSPFHRAGASPLGAGLVDSPKPHPPAVEIARQSGLSSVSALLAHRPPRPGMQSSYWRL